MCKLVYECYFCLCSCRRAYLHLNFCARVDVCTRIDVLEIETHREDHQIPHRNNFLLCFLLLFESGVEGCGRGSAKDQCETRAEAETKCEDKQGEGEGLGAAKALDLSWLVKVKLKLQHDEREGSILHGGTGRELV